MNFVLDRRKWLFTGVPLGLNCLRFNSSIGSANQVNSVKQITRNAPGFNKAKSVLIVYTGGGMSQYESWDPKPTAPAEIRGEFSSIATSVPGIRIGEYLPLTAKWMSKLCLIRSMTHDDLDHGSASYLALTGQFHSRKSSNPPISPNDHPSMSAVLRKLRVPPIGSHVAVHLNGPLIAPILPSAGQNGGFLGRAYEPMILGDVRESDQLPNHLLDDQQMPAVRLDSRKKLMDQLEHFQQKYNQSKEFNDYSETTKQAFHLLGNKRYLKAFDLSEESEKLKDRYGRDRSGQACLLARRLIEIGIPLVIVFLNHGIRGQDRSKEVDDFGWDTHNDIFEMMKNHLLPHFDRSFSTLVSDLSQRGLLDSTLLMCMGEFGRAPLVALEKTFAGSSPGRKHWAACYSIVAAGAGVQGGTVYGASDQRGAYPQDKPTTPADVIATIFNSLGIDPSGHFEDPFSRPYPISTGKPIQGLF